MNAHARVALVLMLVVGGPLCLKASSQNTLSANQPPAGELLSGKQARQLEKTARTPADHERLAEYYRLQTLKAQKNRQFGEDLMENFAWMRNVSRVPNQYTEGRDMVAQSNARIDKFSKLAANHEQIAKTLENGGTKTVEASDQPIPVATKQ